MKGAEKADSPIALGLTFHGSANVSKKASKYPSPITFRPTAEERERLKADAAGMSQSAYIRQRLFGNKASKRVVPEADRVLLAQILAKLGETRIANNLNQIAHQANCGSLLLDNLTVEEINEACLSIAWMRVQLIEALGLKDRNKNSSVSHEKTNSGARYWLGTDAAVPPI